MAQLFTDDPQAFARVSIPILKFEEADDGAVYVYGKATDATLDRDEQIIDPEFAAKSLAHWFESGANVRVMHSPSLYPAGKGVELVSGDDGQWLKSRIVEPTAVRLVKEQVLTAYSVGIAQPQIIRDTVAKRGRVVGGETVEVSLVDRPANPSCGVMLAKMAGDQVELVSEFLGDADATEDGDDTTLKGVNPKVFADLLVKLGKASASAVDKSTLSVKERDNIDKADFAYVDSDGKGHLPIYDESHIRNAISRFDQTNFGSDSAKKSAARKIVSRAKSHGIDVGDDSNVAQAAKIAESDLDKSNSKKDCTKCGKAYNADAKETHCGKCGTKLPGASGSNDKVLEPELEKALNPVNGMPYGLRRLHDVTCAAYSWLSVKAVHPILEKNGIAAALGPSATNLLFQMLEHEMMEDGGTGREARDIGHLAKAYELLAEFLGDEATQYEVLAEARAELHKLFKAANPMAPDNLTPIGGPQTPNPSKFRRPYISGGHAVDSAKPGQHPHIPASSHVPNASQFQRGLITSGHEADSPQNSGGGDRGSATTPTKAPGEGKGVEADLTKAGARERAQSALIAVHDHLADTYPDACLMIPHATDIAYQPLADTTELPNGDINTPTPKATGVEADLVKMMDTDVVKAALAELVDSRFATERETYEEQIGKQATQLKDLQQRYEEIAQQPDPSQAPIRGMAGIEQLLGKRFEEPRDEVKERERKIAQYARWMDSPDPQQREAARDLLTKLAR